MSHSLDLHTPFLSVLSDATIWCGGFESRPAHTIHRLYFTNLFTGEIRFCISRNRSQGFRLVNEILITISYYGFTGKSMSEALIFASTNPQYDNRLFIELPVQYMKIPSSEHGENIGRTWVEHVVHISCSECQNKNKTIFVHVMFSSCSPHVLDW